MPEAVREYSIREQVEIRDRWGTRFVVWHRVGHIMTIIIIALSAMVAAKPKLFGLDLAWYDLFALIVTIIKTV
jgi:hypothetical protein